MRSRAVARAIDALRRGWSITVRGASGRATGLGTWCMSRAAAVSTVVRSYVIW